MCFCLFTFLLFDFHDMPADIFSDSIFSDTTFSPVTQGLETFVPPLCPLTIQSCQSLALSLVFIPHPSSALRPEEIPVPELEQTPQNYTNPIFLFKFCCCWKSQELLRRCSTASPNQKLTPQTLTLLGGKILRAGRRKWNEIKWNYMKQRWGEGNGIKINIPAKITIPSCLGSMKGKESGEY